MGVGTQDVGQADGVAGVGFAAADGVAFAVAGRGERVDSIDGTPGGVQTGNQQADPGLDRHRDRIFRRVTVVGQQIHQLPVAVGVIADAQLCFDCGSSGGSPQPQPPRSSRWRVSIAASMMPCRRMWL